MNFAQRRKFYSSREWRRASYAARERAGFLCQRCKAEGFTKAAQLVHHVKPVSEGGAKLDEKNLQALCFRSP